MRRISTGLAILTFGLASLLGWSTKLRASVIVTTETLGGRYDDEVTVSDTDLFQTDLSSIATTGTFSYFSANTPSLLANGRFGQGYDGSQSVAPEAGASVTFLMDVSVNTSGYTLARLESFAGWDSGRDGQEYTISYSVASAPSVFLHLVTIPRFNGEGGYANTKVSLTDDTGILASHVAAVRYTFTEFENNGTAYREFDAFGSVSASAVPEPSTALLVSIGAALSCVASFRRRTRRLA